MLNETEVQQILDLVCRRTGLVFGDMRAQEVRAAIERARVRRDVKTGTALETILAEDDASLDELVADLTIGETYFFRDPAQFEVLRETVLPELQRLGRPIRAWSAGCATGEEAYSLAVAFAEQGIGADSRIMATDISRPRLERARQGRYGTWSLRGMPDERIDALFVRDGKQAVLKRAFRERVDFGYLNLAQDSYPAITTGVWAMDIILCRNVLIYFDTATVRTVVDKLMDTLSDDGFLMLGASDPPIIDLPGCETIVTAAGLMYRRGRAGSVTLDSRPEPPALVPQTQSYVPPTTRHADPPPAKLRVAAPQMPSAPREVRELANQGRVAEAIAAVNEALALDPMSPELFYLLGVLQGEQRSFMDAATSARRALYLDRDMVVAHMLLANMQSRLGDRVSARRSMLNAQSLLGRMKPQDEVPCADSETAGRLGEMVRVQLQFLENVA